MNEYVFGKNYDGRIVAQSIDRMHHFILPLDLNAEEVQKKLFNTLLDFSLKGDGKLSRNKKTGEICMTQHAFENALISLNTTKDQNVMNAILDYLIFNQFYKFDDEKNVILLDDVSDANIILNNPQLADKWELFYKYAIDIVDKSISDCNNALEVFKNKVSDIPDVASELQKMALDAKNEYDDLIEKEKKEKLTPKEEMLKRKSIADYTEFGLQWEKESERVGPVVKFMNNQMVKMDNFSHKGPIILKILKKALAELQIRGDANPETLNSLFNIMPTLGTVLDNCVLLGNYNVDDINPENLERLAMKMGTTFENINEAVDHSVEGLKERGVIVESL